MKITTLKYALLLVNSLLLLTPYLYSQGLTANKDKFMEAESYFIHEEFSDALPLYIQLKEKFPANYNLDYRIGRCYLYTPYEKHKAIKYLETAIKHINPDYKEGKYNENGAPRDAIFYLADAYRVNNQLDKAIDTYNQFKKQVVNTNYDIQLIDHQIASCKRALDAKRTPIDKDIINIGAPVNSRYSETNPIVTPNEDLIIFASKLPFYQGILYSRKINNKWTEPVNMLPELGVDGDCYPVSISGDGTELYIYRSNDYLGDIFVTNFVNNKWTKIKRLNANINTKYWESHASISADSKTLYFTSNREGGYGGLDIYKSQRASDGSWGPAINLGPEINTRYNEETPFIMPDGKTLYFSSYGHESMGGYDIFVSTQKSNDSWSKPRNLGYPVNSTDDDIFYYPLRDGTVAYTALYDPNGQGRYDIVRLNVYNRDNPRLYTISGTATLKIPSEKTPVYYIALFDKNKQDTVIRKTISGNNISFEAPPGNYEVVITSENNQVQKQPLSISWGSKEINRNMNFNLQPVDRTTQPVKPIILADNTQNKTNYQEETNNNQTDKSLPITNPDNDNIAENNNGDIVTDSVINEVTDSEYSVKTEIPNTETPQFNKSANQENWFSKNRTMVSLIALPILLIIVFIILKRKKKTNNS